MSKRVLSEKEILLIKRKEYMIYIGSKNLDIRNVINIGIEEINNFDKFYEEWLDFLSKKK